MTEEKKLPMQVSQNTGLQLTNMEELQRAASLFLESGMFAEQEGKQALARVCVKIIAGQELGLKPFQAVRGIDVIGGVPSFRYQLAAALVKQSGRYDYVPVEVTDRVAKIQFYDRGRPVYLSVFTMEDAVRRGLAGKDSYKKMPQEMLFARAMTRGVNKVCPEIFLGSCSVVDDSEVVESEVESQQEVKDPAKEKGRRSRNPRSDAAADTAATEQSDVIVSSTNSSDSAINSDKVSDIHEDTVTDAECTSSDTETIQTAAPAKVRVRLFN